MRVSGHRPHPDLRQTDGFADVVVAEAHEGEGKQVTRYYKRYAVSSAHPGGARVEHVHAMVKPLFVHHQASGGLHKQVPRKRENHRGEPNGRQELGRSPPADFGLRLPDDSIIAVEWDESHGQGGDDAEAGVEEAVGDAEGLPKQPPAILAEEHHEGEG